MAKFLKISAVISLLIALAFSVSGCGNDKTAQLPIQRVEVLKIQPYGGLATDTEFTKNIAMGERQSLNVWFLNTERKVENIQGDFVVKVDNISQPCLEYRYKPSIVYGGFYLDPILYVPESELKLIMVSKSH